MANVTYVRITSQGNVANGESGTWIPIDDVDLSSTAGGSNFSLTFNLANDDAIANALNGTLLGSEPVGVEIATYDNSTASASSPGRLVSYTASTKAYVTNTNASSVPGAPSYSLRLLDISQTAFPGGQASSTAYASNVGAATPTPVPADVVSGASVARSTSAAPVPANLTYYVRIKDASGNFLTDPSGSSFFQLSSASTDATRSIDQISGRPDRPELGETSFGEVSFTPANLSGLELPLFAQGTTGQNGFTVQVEAVAGSGSSAYVADATTYSNVLISTQDADGRYSFAYRVASTQHFDSTGKVLSSFGVDTATGKASDGVNVIPRALPQAGPAASETISSTILQTDGPSDVAVSDFHLGFSRPVDSGRIDGQTRISEFDFSTSGGAYTLFAEKNLGGYGGSYYRFAQYGSGDPLPLRQYQLSYPEIGSISVDLVSGDHTYSGGFSKIDVMAYGANADHTSSSHFDLSTVKVNAVRTFAAAASPSGSGYSAQGFSGASNAYVAPSGDTTYIQFRDASGAVVTSPTGQSWFAIDTGKFGLTASPGAVHGSTRDPPTIGFSQLGFSFAQNPVSGTLDDALVSGTPLTAEVATYGASGTIKSDYVFGNGALTGHSFATGTGSQLYDFKANVYQETQYDASGASIGSFSYDASTQKPVAALNVEAGTTAPATMPPTSTTHSTYVQFFDSTGAPLTNGTGSSWFEVASASAGFAVSGGQTFLGGLTLSLGNDGISTQLDAAYLKGSTFDHINVATFDANGNVESQQRYNDATIGAPDVDVTVDNTGGEHAFGFTYKGYGERIGGIGLIAPTSTATVGTGASVPNATDVPVLTTAPPSYSQLSYFGELRSAAGIEIFAGTGNGFTPFTRFSIDLSTSTASFTVSASQAAALAALVDSQGEARLEIAGYDSNGRPSIDYVLTGAQLSGSTIDADTGLEQVDLSYVTLQETLCFAAGTRIATVRGQVAVEDLVVGDIAVTASGDERPVSWTSHRTIARPRTEGRPVRVLAGAFGAGLPKRDLFVSPGHPVLIGADADCRGGHLVPIMCLVNGTTIARVPVEEVTYWHVELDAHDILLAEGLPAESYIDLGSRDWFAGADGALHHPDLMLPGMPGRCRPVAIDGPIVEAERRRLDMVFATRLAAACAWPDEAAVRSNEWVR